VAQAAHLNPSGYVLAEPYYAAIVKTMSDSYSSGTWSAVLRCRPSARHISYKQNNNSISFRAINPPLSHATACLSQRY
jgi:hypothetical protein